MQVASPDASLQAPAVNRQLPERASALRGVLHAVLNAPVDSPFAPLLAVAVGGGAGAGVSLLCNGTSRLFGDTLLGSVLGVVSHQFSRDRHLDQAAHGRRWDVLNQAPKMRAWLQAEDIRFVDRELVKHVHDCMQTLAQGMVDHYHGYCADTGMACDPEAIEEIIRFCIGQCVDRAPFMAMQPHDGCFYLAAIDDTSSEGLTREINQGHSAIKAFRKRGCVFICRELAAKTSPAGRPTQQDPPAAPERISTRLADCYQPSAESMVTIRHRRASSLRLEGAARRPQRWWDN